MPLEKVSSQFSEKEDPLTSGVTQGADPGTTDEMPVLPYRVLYASVPFYWDKDCSKLVENATLSVLLPLDEDGKKVLDIVPSSKSYRAGQYVNWRLYNKNLWEDCYYRNPETGLVEQAWTMHVEYVGQVISDGAIAKDRQRIDRLEALYAESAETVN